MTKRYTITVDFDGVLHSFTSGWKGATVIPDPPVDGAVAWLWNMLQHFDVEVLSARGRTYRDRLAIRRWIKEQSGYLWYDGPCTHGIEEVRVVKRKGPSLVYIDDRALRFTGPDSWPTVQEIHNAKPWFKARPIQGAADRVAAEEQN